MRCDNCFSHFEEPMLNGRGIECCPYCGNEEIYEPIDPEYGEEEDEDYEY